MLASTWKCPVRQTKDQLLPLHNPKPHFPIGFGLSYTTFEHELEAISTTVLTKDMTLTIKVRVEDTGNCTVPGRETILVFYAQRSPTRLARPVKQICSFGKSALLRTNEAQVVEINVDFRVFGVFDPERAQWVVDSGSRFDILVGTTAEDAKMAWEVTAPVEITRVL